MRVRPRRRRANVMLEFAMTLPFMLFLLAFCIDMGRMMYAMNAAQEIVATSARQSAVFGAAGVNGAYSTSEGEITRQQIISQCNATPASCQMALYATRTAISNTPGGRLLRNWTMTVDEGSAANNGFGRVCSSSAPLVKLTLTYEMDWLTPGMRGLLNLVGPSNSPTQGNLQTSTLAANATARCEVEFSSTAP